MLPNFPKIDSPFVRKNYRFNLDDYRKNKYLYPTIRPKQKTLYLVTDEVKEGYEWVLRDSETFCTEKLDGTNIQLSVEGNRLVSIQNRLNEIDLLALETGREHIAEGIFRSIGKGFVKGDGEHAGELVGPKLQGNPYQLTTHEFFPFSKAVAELRYKSFHDHERTFENWSDWFKDYLRSLFYAKRHKVKIAESIFAEGVIFYNLKRKANGEWPWMSKLRRDMFPWFYDKIEIYGYPEDSVETDD